jgi:hypothetical protein
MMMTLLSETRMCSSNLHCFSFLTTEISTTATLQINDALSKQALKLEISCRLYGYFIAAAALSHKG